MSTAELNISVNNCITGSSDERPKDKQIYAIVTTCGSLLLEIIFKFYWYNEGGEGS